MIDVFFKLYSDEHDNILYVRGGIPKWKEGDALPVRVIATIGYLNLVNTGDYTQGGYKAVAIGAKSLGPFAEVATLDKENWCDAIARSARDGLDMSKFLREFPYVID